MPAIITDDLVDTELFVSTDIYFHTVDNRPLWRMMFNITAMNDVLGDVEGKLEECATFIQQTPATDTAVGGRWVCKDGGTIDRIVLSHGTGGSSGSHLIDVNINGTTVYTTQGNRPSLDYNDADGVVSSTIMDVTAVSPGDIISMDVDGIQAGSPVWLRVDVYIIKTVISRDQADYITSGSPLTISYSP